MVANQNNQRYESLVDDCRSIITEAIFNSRWALVEGYWRLGERIEQDFKVFSKGNKAFVQGLARSLKVSERTVYYARQAYVKYPELSSLPEGKNLSWNKLITKYLPQPNGGESADRELCPVCKRPLPEGIELP